MSQQTYLDFGIVQDQDGRYIAQRPIEEDEVIALARRILDARVQRDFQIKSPLDARDYVTLRYGQLQHEVFSVIWCDQRNRVIATEEMFRGTINGASVHPREVVKSALQHNAAAAILLHNHPSGVSSPSRADEQITRRLVDALALIDVRVLDHLVVAGGNVSAFSELGLL